MNKCLKKLFDIAAKPEKRIIGLMSGTSRDGLDIAVCRVAGNGVKTHAEVEYFETVKYPDYIREMLLETAFRRQTDLQSVCLLHDELGRFSAQQVQSVMDGSGLSRNDVDLVASHGQTIYHAPAHQHGVPGFGDATLQIGDADLIAQTTGILTVSDFRQKHIAAGGEGAPLSAYGDYLLYSAPGRKRILLNIGGIANFTYLDGSGRFEEVVTTDTGPGNTLIDAAMRHRFNDKAMDEGGRVAASGAVHLELLMKLKTHPFLQRPLPRTTGPEVFSYEWLQEVLAGEGLEAMDTADLVATLSRFTVETIADTVSRLLPEDEPSGLYVSGGGAHNPVLMEGIRERLPGCEVRDSGKLGLHPDAKEALLFAVLANEMVSGSGFSVQGQEVHFGKISLPN